MSFDDLPTRRPTDPPIPGPHRIVGEEGITHHLVFAGPNTWPKPKPQHWLVHYLWSTALVFSWVIGAITAGLLGLEYGQLTITSRLVCGTITVLAAAGYATHTIRRRRVRN